MPLTPTTRLGLVKPDGDPVTGDFVDIDPINDNMDKLDAAAGAHVCTSGTRPTGADRWSGRFIRESDTGRVYVWNSTQVQWDLVADPFARQVLTSRRTADSATNLTTTLGVDSQLSIVHTATGRYLVTGCIWYRSSTTADFKLAFTHSAGFGLMRWTCDAPSLADVSKPDLTQVVDGNTLAVGGTGALARMVIHGMVNLTNAGTFRFNWAQNTTDAAGNTLVAQESWLRLEPVA